MHRTRIIIIIFESLLNCIIIIRIKVSIKVTFGARVSGDWVSAAARTGSGGELLIIIIYIQRVRIIIIIRAYRGRTTKQLGGR